ncbi:protein SINE3 [Juglans microcarpa x Juglans regia]|uniref:protein SINE3 n=1 Tax=Juglans microcarpa x Juglans regia TaxID=2249226 RepID=UPI001B7F2F82|nr:protein SINE3 [Juglans microcarpa x Juglans regia]
MKEHPTPRKEQARSSELLDRRTKDFSSKKIRKIAKKSLNSAFTSLSEDVTESPKEPVDLFSVSEIADSDHFREISESFLMAAGPALSASSESLFASDLTPSSTVTAEPGGSKISYVEVETAINFLKRSRSQVLKSADTDPRSKRIMDALIEIVIGEFYPHPEERDHIGELILMKIQIVLLCFFLWILAVAVAFFFGSAVQNSFRGPLPT